MLSVRGSRELQAVVLALKSVDSSLRPEMYKRTREHILPDWRGGIQEKIAAKPYANVNAALLLKGTRVAVSAQGVGVAAATSGRPVAKGSTLIPQKNWAAAEFGTKPRKAIINGRRGNTRYQYQRQIMTGFLPNNRKGKFAFKTANEIIGRSVALWVQSTVQVIYEAFEKGE